MTTKLLSIDPSINSTGYAVFSGSDLIRCWHIRPQRNKTRNKVTTKIPAHQRIQAIIRELDFICDEHEPHEAVVEITSGKTSARHKGNGAGLATYGMAVGHVARWAIARLGPDAVTQVYENEWTRGSSKQTRRLRAHAAYPRAYTTEIMEGDKEGDISDAIALGIWTQEQLTQRRHE